MNQNLKHTLISLAAAVAVLLAGWLVGGKGDTAITAAQQDQIAQHVSQLLGGERAGALASPALGPWFSVGDVVTTGQRSALRSANATLCSIQGPAATSTIESASIWIDSQAFANDVEIGIGTTNTATTTGLGRKTLGVVNSYLVASTTDATLDGGKKLIGPWQFLNFNIATGTVSATFAPSGHCSAVFREL